MQEDHGNVEDQFPDEPLRPAGSGGEWPGSSEPTQAGSQPGPAADAGESGVTGLGGSQPPGEPPTFGQPAFGTPGYPHSQPSFSQSPSGLPPFGQAPFGQPPYGQAPFGQPPYGQPPYGQPPYGQAPYGQAPYGQPPYGYPPPQAGRAKRAKSLLTYIMVAVIAAAGGAGLTGYLLHSNPKAHKSANSHTGGGGFPNISIPSFPNTPSSGRPARTAVERAAVNAIRPGLVDISSNLGYQGSQAAATGMVISADGLVLTNNHVITDTTRLYATVFTTGHRYEAKWLGYDAADDVAVIKLTGARGLHTVPLGNSSTVKLGDKVIAIGNAYGQSVAQAVVGSITGLNRTITASDSGAATSETLHGMLQTNAGIVQGDSGGSLANSAGQVIGMVTAAATGSLGDTTQNIGFAIPINRALEIARQIINNQPSPRIQIGSTGFLGVLVPAQGASNATDPHVQRQLQQQQDESGTGFPAQPASPVCMVNDLNAGVPARVAPVSSGALVIGELCGTPADKAGIIAGDVITTVGGQKVTSPSQLTTIMHGLRPDMAVKVIWVDINGQAHTSTLVLVQAPPH